MAETKKKITNAPCSQELNLVLGRGVCDFLRFCQSFASHFPFSFPFPLSFYFSEAAFTETTKDTQLTVSCRARTAFNHDAIFANLLVSCSTFQRSLSSLAQGPKQKCVLIIANRGLKGSGEVRIVENTTGLPRVGQKERLFTSPRPLILQNLRKPRR